MATIDFEVYCECGNMLSSTTDRRGNVEVEPCDKCMQEKYDEGYKDGREEE
jgi:hypothetical protein